MTIQELREQLLSYQPQMGVCFAVPHLSSFEFLSSVTSLQNDVLYYVDTDANLSEPEYAAASFLIISPALPENFNCTGNYLWINEEHGINTVLDTIRTLFRDEHRLFAFGQRMLAILSEDGSLQKIVDEAFLYMGNPILVFDAGFSVIAANWDVAAPDQKTQRILDQKYLDPAGMADINRNNIHDKVMKSPAPIFIKNPSYEGNRLLIRLAFHNKSVGHIAIADTLRPFTPYDEKAAVILRDVVIQCLKKDEFIRNSRGFNYEYLIADLLDGKITMSKNLNDRLAYVDFFFEELLYVTVAELARSEQYVNPTYVISQFEALMPGSKAVVYNGQIVLITTRRSSQRISAEEIRAFSAYCKKESLFCGMSNPFRGVANLQKYYTQALRALELGTQNENLPALYPYANYAVSHILSQFCQKEDRDVFLHPAVKRLLEYDEKKNGNLTETLYQYLLWERNLMLTAQKMYLHRNTLSYRLNKIQELTQVDLEEAETRQYLLWSLHVCNNKE